MLLPSNPISLQNVFFSLGEAKSPDFVLVMWERGRGLVLFFNGGRGGKRQGNELVKSNETAEDQETGIYSLLQAA